MWLANQIQQFRILALTLRCFKRNISEPLKVGKLSLLLPATEFHSQSLQLRQEKIQLEQTLEQEQEYQINKLMRKIDKLESDVTSKQTTLEQVIMLLKARTWICCVLTNLFYSDNANKVEGDGNALTWLTRN